MVDDIQIEEGDRGEGRGGGGSRGTAGMTNGIQEGTGGTNGSSVHVNSGG